MVDVARLGLAVDSSQVEKGTVSLHQLTGAAGQASAAAQKLAGASQAEAAGQKAATTAVQAHNAALVAQNSVIRSSMHQRTMMVYQLNDVAVSLASGMNPAMVAMQQGSQILQGGLMPAIRTLVDLGKSLVVTFWPVAAVVGAVAAAMAGLTYEFNKTADVQVGFFDVALAGWQLLAEGIGSTLAPVFGWIVDRFQQLWDFLAPILKNTGNAIIGAFVGAYAAITEVWGQLPAAMGDVVFAAAQNAINGIIYLIREAQVQMNDFLSDLDGLMVKLNSPVRFGTMQLMGYADLQNPYTGAAGGVANAASGAFAGAQQDYLGAAGSVWSKRAQEIAAARGEMDALGGSTKAANDNVKALDNTSKSLAGTWGDTLKSAWGGFWSDFHSGLKEGKSLWESLGNAGMNALDQLTSKALDMAANGLWDIILGAFTPGFGQTGGTWGNGLWGSAIFNAKGGVYSSPSLSAYSNGVYDSPQMFAFAKGAGVFGEAGPEAIMPLARTSSGDLGVRVADGNKGMAANNNSVSVVRVELSPDLEGRIIQAAGGQTIQIVSSSAPAIAEQGAAKAGGKMASGDFDNSLSRRFGVSPQARRR